MEKVTLFNGNNQAFIDQFGGDYCPCPKFWTTGPLQALDYSGLCAKKFNSSMCIYVFEDAIPEDLGLNLESTNISNIDGFSVDWYDSWNSGCITKLEKLFNSENSPIKIYKESELESFLSKYAPNDGGGFDSHYVLERYLKLLNKEVPFKLPPIGIRMTLEKP